MVSSSLVPRLSPTSIIKFAGSKVTLLLCVRLRSLGRGKCPLFGGKNTLQKCFGTKDSVCCSEFRGGRFSEVANVLQVWDFQSVTRTLSALGSVSISLECPLREVLLAFVIM